MRFLFLPQSRARRSRQFPRRHANRMKQVSFTQLMTYIRCPEHYLFRYILGIRRQPRKVFKRGFALHETLQYHFEEKKKDGKGISLAEAKEMPFPSFYF